MPDLGDLIGLEADQVVPVESDLAGVGGVEAGDDVEQSRFAGAVGSDHPDDLTLVGIEVDLIDGLDSTETLGNAL